MTENWKNVAWYVQYVQHIYGNSYLSARYGENRRYESNKGMNWNDLNGVFGYIYRPKSALSIKLEYRHRERDGFSGLNSDEGLISFSVLF